MTALDLAKLRRVTEAAPEWIRGTFEEACFYAAWRNHGPALLDEVETLRAQAESEGFISREEVERLVGERDTYAAQRDATLAKVTETEQLLMQEKEAYAEQLRLACHFEDQRNDIQRQCDEARGKALEEAMLEAEKVPGTVGQILSDRISLLIDKPTPAGPTFADAVAVVEKYASGHGPMRAPETCDYIRTILRDLEALAGEKRS